MFSEFHSGTYELNKCLNVYHSPNGEVEHCSSQHQQPKPLPWLDQIILPQLPYIFRRHTSKRILFMYPYNIRKPYSFALFAQDNYDLCGDIGDLLMTSSPGILRGEQSVFRWKSEQVRIFVSDSMSVKVLILVFYENSTDNARPPA